MSIFHGIWNKDEKFINEMSLQWRYNEHDGVSNHQHLECLPNHLFWHRSWHGKHQSAALLSFVRGIHPWFPSQRASNAENISIWWRHHGATIFMSMLDLAKISAIETDLHTNVLSHFLRPPSTTGLKTGKKDWPVMGICTSNNFESSLSPFQLKSWKFSTDQAWSLYCNSVIIHWYGNLHLIRNTIFHVERLYPK